MKSFTMKALAVAVLGLAGAGTAMACPTIVGGNASPGGGGAWSSQSVSADTTFASSAGLNGTTCGLGITVNAGALANTRGFVSDTHGASDIGARYRARAYFDISQLTLTLANFQTEIFNAFANTAPGSANTDMIQIYLIGGATPALRFLVADSAQPSNFKTITQPLPASASGHYYFEFDLNQGAPGSFRYWVTPEGTDSADASPTGTFAPNNSGWSGVMQANLGRYSTSANFRTNNVGKLFIVDEFDSRRSSFIGK